MANADLCSQRDSASIVMGLDGTNSWMQDNTLAEGNRFKSRHNEGLNAAFMDGHVKWQRLNRLTFGNVNATATATSTPTATTPMPYP